MFKKGIFVIDFNKELINYVYLKYELLVLKFVVIVWKI